MTFRDFEHAGWEKLPEQYHEGFASLTTQAIPALLDAVGARHGTKLLDVASGPGYVAEAAAKRGADVIGIDFASAMVADARRRYPALRFEEGDAEDLVFGEASFDAVTMNFGLLHLARPARALAEARRVLRPGGRFAFTVWAKPEEARGLGIMLGALKRHGNMDVPLPPGPPFFHFSDPTECRRALLEAGFGSAEVGSVPQAWRFDSPDELFETLLRSTVRNGAMLRAQTPEALEAIRVAVREGALACKREGKYEIPMPAVLASATKGPS
ncbi:MAG: Ubiquinone/menaquinone biosynthesis methyltransferase UbiE [Burkholderiales bacterium]|jgi:SAM-dependent methyltransferase|nr:Ubiquinone/menaquinone biosynthesis methyltransferase UbiE [Burkholderiales bacterium]